MRTDRMEINAAEPVFVTLACHNVFLRLHVPDLPRAVITYSGQNLFAHVKCKTTDSSGVRIDFLVGGEAHAHLLICTREEGVRTSVFRIWSVLYRARAEGRLAKNILLTVLSTQALSLVALFNLLLDISLILLDGLLENVRFLLQLIFLEFQQRLFLLFDEQLLLHFIDTLLERSVVFLNFLDLLVDDNFFIVDSFLVVFMEIPLFSEFVPGGLSQLSLDLGLLQLFAHLLYF